MINQRHRRFYSKRTDKKRIAPMNIKSGMLIEFNYLDRDNNKSMPLVFVVDTDEYATRDKKVFHGINLNYMPPVEVEMFFGNMGHKAGWELDRESKFPKMNIYEEEDAGVRPNIFYKQVIKAKVLNRFDCWRTFKYTQTKSVKQIKWNFQSKELKEVYKNLDL